MLTTDSFLHPRAEPQYLMNSRLLNKCIYNKCVNESYWFNPIRKAHAVETKSLDFLGENFYVENQKLKSPGIISHRDYIKK